MEQKIDSEFLRKYVNDRSFAKEIETLKAIEKLVTEKDIGVEWSEENLADIKKAFSCAIGALCYSGVMLKMHNDDLK